MAVTSVSPASQTTVSPLATSSRSYGTLGGLLGGTSYFERSHFPNPVASNGVTQTLDEADSIALPGSPSTLYTYYRTHQGTHGDAISLAISYDGGATYTLPTDGKPIVDAGATCDWDSYNVISPSVVRVDSTHWYMVYEGQNLNAIFNNPLSCDPLAHYLTSGDVGLATSSDGIIWNKKAGITVLGINTGPGLLLVHNPQSYSFECNNIGTPFLGWFSNQFYIFFHGDCGSITNPKGILPCDPLASNCPFPYIRFDTLHNRVGMAHGTDIYGLEDQVVNASPVLNDGGTGSWDSHDAGHVSVVQEGGYYYMAYEGSQYVFCQTSWNGGNNEGNFGWGIAWTSNIDTGPWQKYAFNPIQQTFQNSNGCQYSTPHMYQYNGAVYVTDFHNDANNVDGLDSVLLPGTDPYLHLYPAVNNGQGQCEINHKIGYVDSGNNVPTGWAQASGLLSLPNRLCYGPYQSFVPAGQYSQGIPAGNYAVTFEDLIDSTFDLCLGCDPVIFHDITYASGSNQLSKMQVYRHDFQAGWSYQDFELQFAALSGSSYSYEWRSDWDANAYIRLHWVALRELDGNLDITPPTASLNPLPADSFQSFGISWSGSDSQTGIWTYDVQVQDNGGAWTNLLDSTNPGGVCCIGTIATSFTYQGACYHTYNFQVRARDNANNLGSYSSPASTYIPCDFTMSNSPSTPSLQAGGSGAMTTLTLTPSSSFSGSVTLSASPPNGISVSFSPVTVSLQSASAASSLTFSANINLAPGPYAVNIVATSASSSHSLQITVQVVLGVGYQQEATFSQAGGVSGSNIIALLNTPVSISVKITSTGTITGPLAILVVQDYGWPFLYIYQWNNLTVTLNSGVNNVNVGSFTPGDLTNPLPGLVHQYFIDAYWNNILVYNPVFQSGQETVRTVSSDFSQYASPATVTMTVGSSTTSTITAGSRNNFAGTVTFSVSTTGPTAPTPPSVSVSAGGSSTSTLTISAGSAVGAYTMVVTGTSGTLVRSVTFSINVVDFSQRSMPSTINVQQGASGTSTIILSSLNAFSGTVSLTISAPSGISLSLNTTSIFLDQSRNQGAFLTVNVGSLVPIGNYTVRVYEASGSLQYSTTIAVQVSNFGLTVTPSTLSAQKGGSGSVTLVLTSLNGYSGPASFSVTSIPGCVNYGFSLSAKEIPAWGTNSSSLSLYPGTSCSPAVNTSVLVQASSGATSVPASFSLTITDFSIQASPTSVTTLAGASSTSTITINPINGFTGTVNLASTTSQSGLTCTLSPTSITGSGTSTLSCSGTVGRYTVTITGTSGNLARPATVAYTVQDFSISSVGPQNVIPGTANIPVAVTSINGYSGSVTLSTCCLTDVLTGMPGSGITFTFNPSTVVLSPNATVYTTMTVTVAQNVNVETDSYILLVLGTSNGVTRQHTYHVFPADFFPTASPSSITLQSGSSATTTISISNLRFYYSATIYATSNPYGPNLSINPSQLNLVGGYVNTTTLTISTLYVPAGSYTVTVTIQTSVLTHTITIPVQVTDFSVSASPSSTTIAAGRSGQITVSATSINGFSGTITLSAGNLPQCVSAAFNPSSLTFTGTATLTSTMALTVGSNCTASTATVQAQETAGPTAHSTPITLTISDYTISISPPTVGIWFKNTAQVTVTGTSLNGYTGTVSLSATNLPACLSSSNFAFNTLSIIIPAGSSATDTLTLTFGSCGTTIETVTIQGSDSYIARTSPLTVGYGTFVLSALPNPTVGNPGTTAATTITVSQIVGGYSDTVALSAMSNLPASCGTPSFNPSTVPLPSGGASTLSVNVGTSCPAGTYQITVSGATKKLSGTTTFSLVTTGFAVSASPNTITMAQYTCWPSTITVTGLSGFSGSVTLSASSSIASSFSGCAGSPGTTTVSVPASGTASATLTFNSCIAAVGTYPVTVTANSNGLVHTTTITVNVIAYNSGCGGGGGGGSLAYGTLITMADGSKVPVQNLKVGDRMLGYNPATGQYTTSTITSISIVDATTMLVINTGTDTPLRVDASPTEILWTKLPDGTTLWLPVTQLKIGDDLWTPNGWVPVLSIASISGGHHIMYDITATDPYFASGYLDPPLPS